LAGNGRIGGDWLRRRDQACAGAWWRRWPHLHGHSTNALSSLTRGRKRLCSIRSVARSCVIDPAVISAPRSLFTVSASGANGVAGVLALGAGPADNAPTEQVQDHLEVEKGPALAAADSGDVQWDGRVELDTSTVERAIKPQILTRKNALFAGSDGGAEYWVGAVTELLPWAWKARQRAA
jgi:hypothetical protein